MNGKTPPPPQHRRASAPVTPPAPGRRPGSGRRRKRTNPLRRLLGVVALATVIGGGIWMGKLFSQIAPGTTAKDILAIYSNPTKFFPNKDRITVLLVGKDYSYNKKFEHYTGKSSRADSILLLTLDFKSKKVTALSIPRDTRVRIAGNTGKINATFSNDSYPGRGGPELLSEVVEDITGVKPDYYIAVKPDAVGNLVEELGGVDVETIDAIEYHDNKAGLHFKLPKGNVHITTANDAIGYCRYREIDVVLRNPDGTGTQIGKYPNGEPIFKLKSAEERARLNKCLENGDTRRMVRQQNMIRAMIASGKSQLYRADKLIDTAFKQFDTNLDRTQLLAIASLYRNTQPEQVASGTLAGAFQKQKPYLFIPDRRKNEALVQWLVYGDEKAANRVTSVAVRNATDISGAARRAAEILRAEGNFDADYVTDGPKQQVAATTIQFTKAVNKPRAELIAKLLGGGTVKKDTSPDRSGTLSETVPDIMVILGDDLAPHLGEQSALR